MYIADIRSIGIADGILDVHRITDHIALVVINRGLNKPQRANVASLIEPKLLQLRLVLAWI